MSEIRRVNTGDAPRNVYHAGDAPRTVNTGRTVKTGSALNQDEYEAARRRAQQLAANNTRRTRSFNRVQQTDVDRYRAAQQKALSIFCGTILSYSITGTRVCQCPVFTQPPSLRHRPSPMRSAG